MIEEASDQMKIVQISAVSDKAFYMLTAAWHVYYWYRDPDERHEWEYKYKCICTEMH
jgi:hypothetical protein